MDDTTISVRSASAGCTPHVGYDDDTGWTASTLDPSLGLTVIVV
jgi:hypothetical protein